MRYSARGFLLWSDFWSSTEIRGSLAKAFEKLYGYTSDENGLRHAGIEITDPAPEDARWMLVACSAFAHYLIAKAARAGLEL